MFQLLPMVINGIKFEQKNDLSVFLVETFTPQIQDLIRSQLNGIFYGFAEVEELPEAHTYKQTLKSFLDRYNSKSEDIKKGMIGELLAHILISNSFSNFSSLSILKNKEERSIKKGFDIIYCNNSNYEIWYTEVKSGRSESKSHCSNTYNGVLLNRSRDGILEMFESKRDSLWESALIDVKLVIEEGPKRLKMRQLLSKEFLPATSKEETKNVILVSVLYHDLSDKLMLESVWKHNQHLVSSDTFSKVILISIQKATFEKIANFILSESKR